VTNFIKSTAASCRSLLIYRFTKRFDAEAEEPDTFSFLPGIDDAV